MESFWCELCWSCCKHDYMWNPSTCHCECECNRACKIDEYLDIKNYSYVKRLFGKLVLACADEILNLTDVKSLTAQPNLLLRKQHMKNTISLFH